MTAKDLHTEIARIGKVLRVTVGKINVSINLQGTFYLSDDEMAQLLDMLDEADQREKDAAIAWQNPLPHDDLLAIQKGILNIASNTQPATNDMEEGDSVPHD